jgi:inosine-uridine nucleoside N-ribohydrolase
MFLFRLALAALLTLVCGTTLPAQPAGGPPPGPVPIIFDTDMCTDCDDAGALAVLHELANRGECEILAVCCSNKSKYSIGACDAINTYFGRGRIPLGAYPGDAVGKDERLTPGYNEIARDTALYHHDVVTRDGVPAAVGVYRKILASRPDRSVSIVVVGFLTNISDLLKSGPDETSALNGVDLVAAKVKELSVMGGRYPGGREYNFAQQGAAPVTKHAIEAWPAAVPVMFCGGELGEPVLTGPALAGAPAGSPVRRAYELMYNGIKGRPSWDPLTVLYAVRGLRDYWQAETGGQNVIKEDGSNTWQPGAGRNHAYLKARMSNRDIAEVLSGLMTGGPAGTR